MSFDKILGDLSQGLRRRDIRNGAPRRLEASILAGLPEPARSTGGLSVVFGLVGGLAAVGVLGTGLVALAHRVSEHHPLAAAATAADERVETPIGRESDKIQATVDAQNTWHLSGHFRGGKRMAPQYRVSDYDIWERRSPFFYREDRFGETVIDDGKTLIHIIPPRKTPDDSSGSTRSVLTPGRIVIHASTHTAILSLLELGGLLIGSFGRPNNYDPRQPSTSSRRVGLSGTEKGFNLRLMPASYNGQNKRETEVIERSANSTSYGDATHTAGRSVDRLTVDRATYLPIELRTEYAYRHSGSASATNWDKPYQSDVIRATYNCPLPDAVTKFKMLPGYSVIDLTGAATGGHDPALPTSATTSLRIQPELLAIDPSSAYAIRLRTNFSLIHSGPIPLSFTASDETGRAYVCVSARRSDPREANLVVSPADPNVLQTQNGSRHITITCLADFIDADPDALRSWHAESMISTSFAIEVPSGVKPSKIDDSFLIDTKGEPRATILERIAVARANYFSGNAQLKPAESLQESAPKSGKPLYDAFVDRSVAPSTQLSPEDAARAAQWWDVAANEAERIGTIGVARQYRSRAKLYRSR